MGTFYLSIYADTPLEVTEVQVQVGTGKAAGTLVDEEDDDDNVMFQRVEQTATPEEHKLSDSDAFQADTLENIKAMKKKFEDPQFPANLTSIFRDPAKPWTGHPIQPNEIVWRRPSQICTKPVLFDKEGEAADHAISADDMVQGALGNAWFVGAVACISLLSELVMDIFVDDDEFSQSVGAYKVKFFKKTQWIEVLIDDRIPCYPNGKPLYGRGKNENEIWPMLLEKAYAKLHGCYENLIAGRMTYALQDLTGGAPQTIAVDPDDAMVFLQMQSWAANDSSLMGCASTYSAGVKKPDMLQGIIQGHSYGVIDVKTVGNFKLVKVRNPWGSTEWKGDWSDDSPLWETHPEVQKACRQADGNDGTFWISWGDFNDIFNSLYVVHKFPKSWEVQNFHGMWTQELSGGCCKHGTWMKNPQFAVHVEKKDTMLYVVISQDDMRMKQVCGSVRGNSP
jgi:hypothetical protein